MLGNWGGVLIGDAPPTACPPTWPRAPPWPSRTALVLAACLRHAATVREALTAFVARRSPRTGWVRAQAHRRDRTRNLPPVLRDLTLRLLGRRIFRSSYRPLRQPI
jgi:hypothetical protein